MKCHGWNFIRWILINSISCMVEVYCNRCFLHVDSMVTNSQIRCNTHTFQVNSRDNKFTVRLYMFHAIITPHLSLAHASISFISSQQTQGNVLRIIITSLLSQLQVYYHRYMLHIFYNKSIDISTCSASL